MTEIKYTYQDWIEGKLDSFYLGGIFARGEISKDDYTRIVTERNEAYSKYITRAFDFFKKIFKDEYDRSFLKHRYIDYAIARAEMDIGGLQRKYHNDVQDNSILHHNGSEMLTKKEVEEYLKLSTSVTEEDIFVKMWWSMTRHEHLNENNCRLYYIVYSNYHQWLLWFKEQESISKVEPTISINTDGSPPFYQPCNTIGYQWLASPDKKLPKLYNLLISKALLHPDSTLEQFKAVFTGQPLQYITPIEWTERKALLAYFLDCLHNKGKIPRNTNVWSIAEKCFTNAKNLTQSRNNYERTNTSNKPKKHEIIDEILESL